MNPMRLEGLTLILLEQWVLHCCSGLLEDWVRMSWESHLLAFPLKPGELPAVVDGGEGLP